MKNTRVMQSPIRVLLVDDQEVVRVGVGQCIAAHRDLVVCGEASSGDMAIELVRTHDYDVVVLDIAMPGRSGFDTLPIIKRARPQIAVLMYSSYPERHFAINCIKAGASGYVHKGGSTQELIKAIRLVARGQRYLGQEALARMSEFVKKDSTILLHESLSMREFQIFYALARGEIPTRIAQRLHLSVKTVSTYRTRILTKMGLKTNTDLTFYAIRNALFKSLAQDAKHTSALETGVEC